MGVGGRWCLRLEALAGDVDQPVCYQELPVAFWEGMVRAYSGAAIVDLTPGSGRFAQHCVRNRLPYVGVTGSLRQKEYIMDNILNTVMQELDDPCLGLVNWSWRLIMCMAIFSLCLSFTLCYIYSSMCAYIPLSLSVTLLVLFLFGCPSPPSLPHGCFEARRVAPWWCLLLPLSVLALQICPWVKVKQPLLHDSGSPGRGRRREHHGGKR